VLSRQGRARWGYDDVVVTNDSASAVALSRRSQPDIVPLDLCMPEPDGLALPARVAQPTAPRRLSSDVSAPR
jgi:CheY-like chemotaxis protein